MPKDKYTGAEIVLKVLQDQDVDVVFGYPGGVTLPLYDQIYKQNRLRHILPRHEQAAVHAAEGYARTTGKVGVVLVTSGPGATNTVTGLTDALMDSIPVVCITGQVPTSLIGNDAFQEADTTGITRSCTKHNYLVRSGGRSRPHPARGLLCRPSRAAGAGGRRSAEGRDPRPGRLHPASGLAPSQLQADGEGRHQGDPRGGEADGGGQAADPVRRRRHHQFRPGGLPAVHGTGPSDRLSLHPDLDGAGRGAGVEQAVCRYARHAWHLRGEHGRCTTATSWSTSGLASTTG